MGTQLYKIEGNSKTAMYPNALASDVQSSAISGSSNVDDALKWLNDKISEISGDKEAVTNINIVVDYGLSKTKDQSELKATPPSWSNTFTMPNSEFPYAWKKTEISVAETTKEFYEIVASDTADSVQNIYVALGTDTQPIIIYPKKTVDGEETSDNDLTAFDKALPNSSDGYVDNNGLKNVDWSEKPQSIAPDRPFLYMSTRKRTNGLWGEFSTPAMLGKWAFDSKLELRYLITNNSVNKSDITLNASDTNPGENWSLDTPDSYSGKLWMITATSVNGILNKDSNNIIWNGPHLLSIIQ